MRYTQEKIDEIVATLERSITDPVTGEINEADARADIYTEDVCRARNALMKVFRDYTHAIARLSWTGTQTRHDLRKCPFCGTTAVQQVRLADSDTNVQYRVACGNPFCEAEPATPPRPALVSAECIWNERAS